MFCSLILLEAILILFLNARIGHALGLIHSYLDRSLSSVKLASLHQLLDSVARAQGHLPTLEQWISSRLHSVSESLGNSDEAFSTSLQHLSSSLREADQVMHSALDRFMQHSSRVHEMIRNPAVRLSDLFRTSTQGVRTFVSRVQDGNGEADSFSIDESNFI